MREATCLIESEARAEAGTADRLLAELYDELRLLAAAKMAREPAGHTLQPTALVHEAWLRLGGDNQAGWQNRGHFFGAAAEAMRRILVERARRRLAARRGGAAQSVAFDGIQFAGPSIDDDNLLRVNDAVEALAAVDPRKAELVKLR